MKAVIRRYSGKGAKELLDALEKQAADLQSVMGSVEGLVSYTLPVPRRPKYQSAA